MNKAKTFLLLGLSLVLLAGLFLLTQFIDQQVDKRFSNVSQTENTPAPDTQQTPAGESSQETPPQTEDVPPEDPLLSIQEIREHIIYDTLNQPHNLEDFADRPVVLYFWASHSSASTSGLSVMETFFQKHGDKVYFLVVNVTDGEKETRQTADAYLADNTYPFPVYYDLDGLCNEYYKKKVPLAIFFGNDGKAKAYFNSKPTSNLMQTCLQEILS